MENLKHARSWTPAYLLGFAAILLVANASAVRADRIGWVLSGDYVAYREQEQLQHWIDAFGATHGMRFSDLDPEFGASLGATIFKGRRARAFGEFWLELAYASATDSLQVDWLATSVHGGMDMSLGINLLLPPKRIIPYVGVGLGMDVAGFRLGVEGDSTSTDPLFGRERLGFINVICGIDWFVSAKTVIGLSLRYRFSLAGTLHVFETTDSRLKGHNLPTMESFQSHPDDPRSWSDMQFNAHTLVVSVVIGSHAQLSKGPGVEDD